VDDNSVFNNGGTTIAIHAVAGTGAPPRIAGGMVTRPE